MCKNSAKIPKIVIMIFHTVYNFSAIFTEFLGFFKHLSNNLNRFIVELPEKKCFKNCKKNG